MDYLCLPPLGIPRRFLRNERRHIRALPQRKVLLRRRRLPYDVIFILWYFFKHSPDQQYQSRQRRGP